MKKFKYIFVIFILTLILPACSDDMSQRLLFEEDQQINTERSAFYAMTGILQQLQKVGDSYVIFGELRGDLMDVTQNSSQELRDISNFETDSTNSYLNPKEYYAIINNCNNLIAKIDTNLVISGSKALKLEMSAAKSIRAWSYLQLFLNYGKVYYYSKPMLSVDAQYSFTTITDFTQFSDSLIADLTPWKPADNVAEQFPGYGTIGAFSSSKLFIPIRFVLGELYLWRAEYAQAAKMYYQIIYTNQLTVLNYKNSWNSTQTGYVSNWTKLFTDLTLNEQLSYIGFSDEYANNTKIPAFTSKETYMLAPSKAAINTWESQTYSFTNTITQTGDLRGRNGSYSSFSELNELNDNVEYSYITKYKNMTNYVSVCRATLVYLRYAEAVNRMGKPSVAFVFLKYGLNKIILENTAYTTQTELKTKEAFIDFGQSHSDDESITLMFKNNIGMHSRGCGLVDLNNSFRFPAGVDSVEWVEDQLVTEYALETAFEGNRFNDLMRISNHRNDPTFLANKVAAKFPDEQKNSIIQLLSDKKNWYLPEKK